MLKKTLAASAAAAALTVGVAGPAFAGNDARWFVENRNDYALAAEVTSTPFEVNESVSSPFDVGIAPSYSNYDDYPSNGDRCSYSYGNVLHFNTKNVAPGETQYLCFTRIANGPSLAMFTAKDMTATTDSGTTYPLSGGLIATRVSNPLFGEMVVANYPGGSQPAVISSQLADVPEWLGAELRKEGDGYSLTWKVNWEPPVAQEAQLMSLMDVTSEDCTITGTDGPDVLEGTDGDDVICGLGGDDVIDGKGGDDIIKGGAGDDQVKGGAGDDVMGGGSGDDQMDGGAGDDAMHGGMGADILVGGGGDDLTDGGSGEDILLPDMTGKEMLATLGMSWLGDSRYEYQNRKTRSETSMMREYQRERAHVNTTATTDTLGNVVEDGNGDNVTAQGTALAAFDPCATGFFNPSLKDCTAKGSF